VAAVRDPGKFIRRFPRATAFAADLNSMTGEAAWLPHLDGINAIVNCAGAIHDRHGQSLAAIHADAPTALFRAAVASGIRKIVQISAVSVGAPTIYAKTKLAADRALMALDCDWVVLRPSIVYGAGAYGGTAMLRALAATPCAIPVIGAGDQKATPIHVDDLASAIALCLETDRCNGQVLEPAGPETLTLADMCQHYRQWLGLSPAPLLHVPRSLIALAAWMGDRVGSGPVTSTSLAQLDFGNAADGAAFAAATGLNPRSMTNALTTTPAQTGDLWHARAYLFRPLIRAALVLLWLGSGLAGLLASPPSIHAVLSSLSLGETMAEFLGRGASLIDLAIAALLVWGRAPQFTFLVQTAMVVCYTVLFTFINPSLWVGLFGPLLKNIPILALIAVDRILAEER
jgi:uncharacterized protein YbjT (DUF2867 family)